MNFLTDEQLTRILEIGARFMAAAGEMRMLSEQLAREDLSSKQRAPLYTAYNMHHNVMWRAGAALEELLLETDWWRSMILPLPQQDRANAVYIVLFNQIAALRDQVETEKNLKFEALRRLA